MIPTTWIEPGTKLLREAVVLLRNLNELIDLLKEEVKSGKR